MSFRIDNLPFDVIIEIARTHWKVWYKLSISLREFGLYSIQPSVKRAAQKRFREEHFIFQKQACGLHNHGWCHFFTIRGVIQGMYTIYRDENMTLLYSETPFIEGKREGVARVYLNQGSLYKEINYVNNLFHGTQIIYFHNKQIDSVTTFKNGKKHGPYRRYFFETNKVIEECNYTNGKKNGVEVRYTDDDDFASSGLWKHGKTVHHHWGEGSFQACRSCQRHYNKQ